MNFTIFPKPKQIEELYGQITVSYPLTIMLPEDLNSLYSLLNETLKCEINIICDRKTKSTIKFEKINTIENEGYYIEISLSEITISYNSKSGAYYALITLSQILNQHQSKIPCCKIEDKPSLSIRGYMLDISRGKVPTLEDLCNYVDRLARLKYNQLQLYVEGVFFAYPSYTEMWKDKTPITGEEIQYLDKYCKDRCIELVLNQNSLGHMSAWLSRKEFNHLAETENGMKFMESSMPVRTLDAINSESLELVTSMMDDMLPFFTSNKFNVNLDEPFELGKGKNKKLAEEKGEAYIYMDYLKRLHERVEARGKHMYMWGDILANHPETLSQLPKNITVLDWSYESFSPFEKRASILQKNKIPFILCPGTSVWTTLTGRTDNMMKNIFNATKSAITYNGKGVLLTSWGDGGHLEYEPLNNGATAYAASCIWGNLDTEDHEYVII